MRLPVLSFSAALAAALLPFPRPTAVAQPPGPLIVNGWPFYSGELARGRNILLLQNNVLAPVKVMVRFRGDGPHAVMGRDVELDGGKREVITVPDGQYEIYYRYGIHGTLQLWGAVYIAGRDLAIDVPAPGAPAVADTPRR